jgi:hypothetical protein
VTSEVEGSAEEGGETAGQFFRDEFVQTAKKLVVF